MNKTQLELIDKTDKAITELVYPKYKLQKAYNYYNGVRDPELFKYLEENYGIGSPTSVEFIPLVKKHIDALIGEYLGVPIIPKISCKDKKTISNISRDKLLKILSSVSKFLQSKLKNSLLNFLELKNPVDPLIQDLLTKLMEDVDLNFISDYEIAASNIITYLRLSRSVDLETKLKQLLLDILVSGYCFFEDKPSSSNTNVEIHVYSPLNVFPDRNPNSPYVKDSHRIVVRKWMTADLILEEYGKKLHKADLEKIKSDWDRAIHDDSYFFVRSRTAVPSATEMDGIVAGDTIIPGFPVEEQFANRQRYTPVYEVQWIETDKNFVMQRYSTVRIGQEIYIFNGDNGRDENVVRDMDNPNKCSLTVNGVYFLNRGRHPYSLMLACASLQDKYDLLNYYRDNLIANSGTVGDWIDESLIPTNLGVKWPERIQKWLAYKKQGIGLIDTAQEGRLASGQAPINTIFNGFDDTIKVQAIQAIQLAIDSIELTCSSITGVFRERLNGIELRDAVTNVKMGAQNSFIITKQYYQLMDLVTSEMLLEALNVAKIVYKNGLTGTIILGDKYQKIFTALPKHFTLTNFDVHVITSTEIMLEMLQIQQILPELVKSGLFSPDIIIEALAAKSLTELKHKITIALRKQKEENNQLQQTTQQNEELLQLLKQLQQQLEQANQKVQQLNEAKLQIDQQKLQLENKVEWYKAQTDRNYKEGQNRVDEKKVEIERLQMYDGNPYNDEVNYK